MSFLIPAYLFTCSPVLLLNYIPVFSASKFKIPIGFDFICPFCLSRWVFRFVHLIIRQTNHYFYSPNQTPFYHRSFPVTSCWLTLPITCLAACQSNCFTSSLETKHCTFQLPSFGIAGGHVETENWEYRVTGKEKRQIRTCRENRQRKCRKKQRNAGKTNRKRETGKQKKQGYRVTGK